MKKTDMAMLFAMAAGAAAAGVPSPVPGFPGLPDMPAEFMASPAEVLKAARSATADKYPDADVVILDDRIHTRYEADGTYVMWDEEWVKIMTESGSKEYGTADLHFSQRYGDAGVLACQVFPQEGGMRELAVTGGAVRVATDNSSMSQNIYDPLDKRATMRIPGLKPGDVRRVVTCRRALKPRARDFWGDIATLEYTYPILATTVTFDAPEARLPMSARLRNPVPGTVEKLPERRLRGRRRLYAWKVRDVPQAHPEPDSPPLYTQVQSLRLSTAADWREISTWYWKICKPHLDRISPEIAAKTAELTKGLKSRDDKIKAIYRFVSQEIRYMGLTVEDTSPGYEPHDVDLTFRNRYGVCRDKAALLAAMLMEAGIQAFPVLIHAGAKLDGEVPQPFFNHAITAVEREGNDLKGADRYILMDSTDETSSELFPAYLSNKSFLVAREGGETLLTSPTPPASANGLRVASRGSVSPDGSIYMKTKIETSGMNDNIYRGGMLRRSPEERRLFFERVLSALSPGSELLSLEISPADLSDTSVPLTVELVSKIRCAVLRGETADRLSVPFFSEAVGLPNFLFDDNTSLPARRFTLLTTATAESVETVEIDTRGRLGAAAPLPPPAVASSGDGGFEFSLSYGFTNGVLSATRTWRANAVEFAPETYPKLKAALAAAQTAERLDPLFAGKRGDDADVRTIKSIRTVNIKSPHSWVQTNAVVQQVLTYNGMKSSSEITLRYCPEWKNVEIVHASVKNPDGTTHVLDKAKEVNVMDASWNGAAPRYSPGKIMVVSLPAVTKGSVISLVTATAVSNSPAPFAASKVFDGPGPVDFSMFAVNAPADLPLEWRETGVAATVSTNRNGTVDYEWGRLGLRPVKPEPACPPALAYRPSVQVALPAAYAAEAAKRLSARLAAARAKAGPATKRFAREAAAGASGPAAAAQAIRNALHRRVRIAGPGCWAVPLAERNFASPDDVLREGYASAADYVNTLAALLESAGCKTRYMLGAGDAGTVEELAAWNRAHPDVAAFASPVLHVRPGRGWRNWIWPFKTRPSWYVGTQNEYTPIDTCAYAGDTLLDVAAGTMSTLEGVPAEATDASAAEWTLDVSRDGSVAFSCTDTIRGPKVGAWRRKWSELLPEERRREHARIVSALSRDAVASGPLAAATNAYPATLSWSAKSPGYATISDGVLSLVLPSLPDAAFGTGEGERMAPVLVKRNRSPLKETFTVNLPAGWTKIEHVPESFTLSLPGKGGQSDIFRTTTETANVKEKDGSQRLVLKIVREYPARETGPDILEPGAACVLQAWNRRMADPALRTISVRKAKGLSAGKGAKPGKAAPAKAAPAKGK